MKFARLVRRARILLTAVATPRISTIFSVTCSAGAHDTHPVVRILDGQRLRLAGQGGPGIGNAPRGDLYLEIALDDHKRYRVDGRDVTADLPLAPWEAALGAEVAVPTPSGLVSVTVPAVSSAGRRLRPSRTRNSR